jgi:hypothetical protein
MRQIAALLLLAACAEAPLVKTTLPVHALQTPSPLSQDGVTISVDPISYDSWKGHGQIVMRISWQEIDRNAPMRMGAGVGGSTPTVTRSAEIALVPLPSVLVSISNQGQKPINLGKVRLSDGAHQWAMMDSVGDVQGRVQSDVIGAHNISESRPLLDGIANAVAQLPIATAKTTVAPGQTWQGYVCFKLDVHDVDEFNDFMDKTEKLTLTMDAFTVDIPRQTQKKDMMCPGDGKKPRISKCKES